jgi:ribosomal protein S18 acetylase RimI-like enzyme
MDVRRLTPADAAAYRALRLRALREHPEAFTSSYEEECERPPEQAEERLRHGAAFWGAFVDAQLVGMVGLDREQRVKNRHKATVVAMYVAPEFARRGAGHALMRSLVAHARETGLELLVLTVTHGNDEARNLYERVGFSSFGIEPNAIKVGARAYAKNHMAMALH